MPAPTVNCTICNNQVSKRSTLSLSEIGGAGGRACREHPEVELLRQQHQKMELDKVKWAKAEHNLQVMMLVAGIRTYHTFFGYPLELMRFNLSRGYPKAAVDAAFKEVEEKGAVMSTEEVDSAVFGALTIAKNRSEGRPDFA